MIFIAVNHDGYIISIVNAKSLELANAYWQGANIIPNTVLNKKDFTPLDEHPTGVIPLLKTRIVKIRKDFGSGFTEIVAVDK